MSDVTIPLTADVARAIVVGIAAELNTYNKGWAWWAHDAKVDKDYKFGTQVVHLAQRVYPDDDYGSEYHGDSDIELVFRINDRFFRITGEYSSYGSDEWSGEMREVKPTKVVRQVFSTL